MESINKKEKIKQVFLSTLYLSAVTFGGGYVIVSFMRQIFVERLKWLSEEEMLDLIAIAQSSPGAVAINGAIAVGYRLAGIQGVIAGILGSVIPPLIIITVLAGIYNLLIGNTIVSAMLKGMQSGIAAIIASVVLDMIMGILKKENKFLSVIIMTIAFVLNFFYKTSAIKIIIISGLLGIFLAFLPQKGKREENNEV